MESSNQPVILTRLKKLAKFKRSGKDTPAKLSRNVESSYVSPFLQLPAELRIQIYEYAFERTPIDHLKALHFGPGANSASGLMLVCRQISDEVREAYIDDTVVNLWPHCPQDALPYDSARAKQRPMLLSWQKSRNGIILERNLDNIHRLALLVTLTRETQTMCEHFVDADILQAARFKIKDLYLRICICGALNWLLDTPARVMSFCIALEMFAYSFPNLERIHILYCGLKWPVWLNAEGDVPFPGIALSTHEMRMCSGANWSIRNADMKKRSWGPTIGRDSTQVQPTPSIEIKDDGDLCRLRTLMTWNHSQIHPGQNTQQVPWTARSVEINYYDSWNVLRERCVRNKPPQEKSKPAAGRTRSVSKSGHFSATGSTVKHFVEELRLGPTLLPHRARLGGEGELGSHGHIQRTSAYH